MRAKFSLELGPRGPLSREMAWGCLTSNLALPGSGSLLAGRRSGYVQIALAFGGLILTGVFSVRFLVWFVANWHWLTDPDVDLATKWTSMGPLVLWPVAGIVLFAIGWVWALVTSWQLVLKSRPTEPPVHSPQ